MLGFILWEIVGSAIIILGIAAFVSKREAGFWANVRSLPMKDVKGYNRAVGKLFLVFGIGMDLLGLPLLAGENSPAAVLLPVLGVVAESIAAMAVYTLVIQPKYEKK